ncbi:MAG: hypothetical protein ACYTDW_05450, partial [Planctomycetota bacterium]
MTLSTSSGNGVKLSSAGYITRRRILAATAAVLTVSCFVLLLCNWQDTAFAGSQVAKTAAE